MDIISLGHSSFRIRGKTVSIVLDPYDPSSTGLKFPKHIAADIITVSHEHKDHNAVSVVEGEPYVIRGPGEYEIKGVSVVGFPTYHDDEKGEKRGKNTIYHIYIDGVNLVHLGDLGDTLSSTEVENLNTVDILFVPVGGVYTVDAVKAAKLVGEISPSVVIPMHYHKPELNQETFGNLSPLSAFLKEMGKEDIQPQPKLSITKDKIPSEMQVVVL